VAGAATAPQQLQSLYAPGEDLPCADFAFLALLKRSPEYRAIRRRVADPKPIDAWQEEGWHYFLFQLLPENGQPASEATAPVVLFTMVGGDSAPLSALIITPSPSGGQAEVTNLSQPGSTYSVDLSAD
jgi:hypothetical protein